MIWSEIFASLLLPLRGCVCPQKTMGYQSYEEERERIKENKARKTSAAKTRTIRTFEWPTSVVVVVLVVVVWI